MESREFASGVCKVFSYFAARDEIVVAVVEDFLARKKDRVKRSARNSPVSKQSFYRDTRAAPVIKSRRLVRDNRDERIDQFFEVGPIAVVRGIVVVFRVMRSSLFGCGADPWIFNDEVAGWTAVKDEARWIFRAGAVETPGYTGFLLVVHSQCRFGAKRA